MEESFDNFLETAIKAAVKAGEEALEVQKSGDFETFFKYDGSPVTNGDKNAEKRIIKIISEAFPDHRLVGEESGEVSRGESNYTWFFDPVDGTWSFLNQENTACVNIVLMEKNTPVVSVVYNPFTHELYKAVRGGNTTFNDTVLPVTKWDSLGKGVLNYQLAKHCAGDISRIIDMWTDNHIGKLISMGGAPAYNLALTAKGAHTVYIIGSSGKAPDPWDYSSGVMLVRNAGGRVTDINGNDIDPLTHKSYIIASTNMSVHDEILDLIRKYGIGSVDR